MDVPIATEAVVRLVDTFIDGEFRAAESNPTGRSVLDYSGRFLAHQMACHVYVAGWQDGSRVADIQLSGELRRGREEARRLLAAALEPEVDLEWVTEVKTAVGRLLSTIDQHGAADIDPAISADAQRLAALTGWSG